MCRVEFQEESFFDIESEVAPLWEKHWHTSGLDHDKIKLDPDLKRYRAVATANLLHIVTARKDGKLIGYYFNFILERGLHYNIKEAHSDIYFIDCDDAPMARLARYRGLFRAVHAALADLGVRKTFTSVKDHADISEIFVSLGYKLFERSYYKLLGFA